MQSREFITLNKKLGWKKGFPWLFYNDQVKNILNADEMIMQMALRTPIVETEVHDMDFYILKYSLEGEYLGMEPLES